MALFQGVLFLCLGIELLFMDYHALSTGWLPCGPNGFKGRLEFRKDKQPNSFCLMFLLYGLAGLWLVLFSLQLSFDQLEQLPLN